MHHAPQEPRDQHRDGLASAERAQRGRQAAGHSRGRGRAVRSTRRRPAAAHPSGADRERACGGLVMIGKDMTSRSMSQSLRKLVGELEAALMRSQPTAKPADADLATPTDSMRGAAIAGWTIVGLFFGV